MIPEMEKNMESAKEDSVRSLINKLCLGMLRQHENVFSQEEIQTAVPKLRGMSYEIMLKKTPGSWDENIEAENDDDENFEPHREIERNIFAYKCCAKANREVHTRLANVEEQLEAVKNEPYFWEGTGKTVIKLLLAVQGNIRLDSDEEEKEEEWWDQPRDEPKYLNGLLAGLLVPSPFSLNGNYKTSPNYPKMNDYDLMNPQPKFFGLQPLESEDNPYIPRFFFEGEKNLLKKIYDHNLSIVPPTKCITTKCFYVERRDILYENLMYYDPKRLQILPAFNYQETTTRTLQIVGNRLKKYSSSQDVNPLKRIYSWNWEGLGCFGVPRAKPFAGDSNVSMLLNAKIAQDQNIPFDTYILKLEDFITDLKALSVGIQSDTFYHNDLLVFTMKKNVSIDGVLPGVIESFAVDFLVCGTCYKRLSAMTMSKNYRLLFEGFMFKALCSAIDEFLLTFRQFIFAKEDKTLLGYYKRTRKMVQLIQNLSFTLTIHPIVDASSTPLMGSQFLGYLYREIMRLTQDDYVALLIFILKRCCLAYFRHLEKWIFYGVLDDSCSELLIGFVDHYRENTKYFYDKAYFIRKEVVPGFFHNVVDQILQCGKYTMLLKAFKPEHPLFEIECPALSVCISLDEVEKLNNECKTYFKNASKVCPKALTIREVFEIRAEEKRNFYQRMMERSNVNLERWTVEQQELAVVLAEKKKKQLEELTAQLNDAKQRRVQERKINVELELKYLRDMEKLEEQRLVSDNANLKKRLEYYQELSDMITENRNSKEISKDPSQSKIVLQIPTIKFAPPPPQTPASTNGTDYESCFGDDDSFPASSEYEECISDDFVVKFKESEIDLKALYNQDDEDDIGGKDKNIAENSVDKEHNEDLSPARKEKEENSNVSSGIFARSISDVNKVDKEHNEDLSPARKEKEENSNVSNGIFARSISDVINCNALPSSRAAENCMLINKEKAMSSRSVEQCINTIEIVATNALITNSAAEDTKCHMTEAQRNKQKVLAEEYGIQLVTDMKPQPDINLNTLPENQLSDLQRNRRRMMQNDLFCEIDKDPLEARNQLYLNLDSDRARNRQKVLESEFNILTGRRASENSNLAVTPMSTTSDNTPITELLSNGNQADKDNGNNEIPLSSEETNEVCENQNLKIDVTLANNNSTTQVSAIETAGTFLNTTTPECALNTAGLMAKQGFSFPESEQKLKQQQQQQQASNDVPSNNFQTFQLDEFWPEPDYTDPYKRCRVLLETKFKCKSTCPYIRINKHTGGPKRIIENESRLTGINVTTLTDFLQKSVTLPMNIHLKLVNCEVMRMFLEDLKVIDHFRSLRNYYLMMDGEFGAIICDGIIAKLENGVKPEKLLNYQILHSILDTALGSSITGKDKNSENLSFIIDDVPEKFDINSPDVLYNLSLSYRINWPLNLILSPETMEQYSNIFKHLFRVRRISWILEKAYQILKECVKQYGKVMLTSPEYRHVQFIRHKFYHFVHTLQNHVTANALQASWKQFKDDLITAKTIEDIYRKHTIYIKRILFLCMLNKRSTEFYNTIDNVFKITIRFYNTLKSRQFRLKPGHQHYTHSRYEKLVNDEVEFDKFIKYTIYLGNKIVQHGYQAEIGEFISLINYNQYYMKNVP